MHRAGIEFGSHTLNHPKLVELPWDQIELETRNSKLEIEMRLGVPVTSFAYPYAYPQADHAFTARFREVLVATGYENCVTTTIGRAQAKDDRYVLPRLPANSDDDDCFLRGKLCGGYDWLAGPQALVKKLKGRGKAPSAVSTPSPIRWERAG
jgi:peptidoglycan/xylan/chitin deacetylase (PgdA/CDA1 family)